MTELEKDLLRNELTRTELREKHQISAARMYKEIHQLREAGYEVPNRRDTCGGESHTAKHLALRESGVTMGPSLTSYLTKTQLRDLGVSAKKEGFDTLNELCSELLLDYLAEKGKL